MKRLRRATVAHLRHPRVLAVAMLTGASAAIVLNALLLQPRPHPAPYFSTREAGSDTEHADELVRTIQTALKHRAY